MTSMFSKNIALAPYTGSSSTGRAVKVDTMPDVTSVVFVVDDDVSVRESLEGFIKAAGLAPRDFRVAAGIPVPPSR